jgi:hypothetical protein
MPEIDLPDGLESQESKFNEQFKAWLVDVKTVHEDQDSSFLRSLVPTAEQLPRIANVIHLLTSDIIARCTDRRWSDQGIKHHISEVAYFLRGFDDIIRPYQHSETAQVERPWFLKKGDQIFWRHLEFGKLYRETTTEQRHTFSDQLAEFRRFIAYYLGRPELQYPYLDWLVLDTVTACSLVECMEILMERKHGIAYEFCGANPLKLVLFKCVWHAFFWPLKWVAPAVLAWWTAQYSLTWTLVVGGLYYAVNLILLLLWIIGKVQLALSGKPSLEDIFNEQLSAYGALFGPVLHAPTIRAAFERVAAKGATWNQEALVILDRVVANPPPVWRND